MREHEFEQIVVGRFLRNVGRFEFGLVRADKVSRSETKLAEQFLQL